MEALEIFSSTGTFERKVLRCASSRKDVSQDMRSLDEMLSVDTRSTVTGVDYVSEYVEKEEREFLESASMYTKNDAPFDEVSQITSAPVHEVNQADLTKLYKTYNFEYRPKQYSTIVTMKDHIVSMIETNSVVVIQGPTGCGKTTQVPQFILDACYKKRTHCNIIVTQPRRIAAMSIAKRVSQEREWPVGTLVGYKVGLINNTCPDTRLTYCTTGVLLHKLINAKNMLDYTHVILDEVHERDKDMDFLLLVVRKLLRTNSRTVKVVLMSATFEVERFAKYFSSPVRNKLIPAPIIDVAKKSIFNIATFYLCELNSLGPLPEVSAKEPSISTQMMKFCVNLIVVLDDLDKKAENANYDKEKGLYDRHVTLVFLPGIHEIEEMHSMLLLSKYKDSKWDVVVLHSSITNEEQQRIFQKPPVGFRRIILSTNIAESSITVPDVKYVIDFCLTKQLVVDRSTNFQCLELMWTSKSSCTQRAGRTGRVMDGRVYRMVPKTFYEKVLPSDGLPEMLRAPLENLVLKAKILDMGEPKAILALSLDPPDLTNLERTILLLKEAGALLNIPNDHQELDGKLTDLGRVMAHLPLDIHISKLIMLGHVFSVFKDTITIAASMATKDMFNNPFRQKLLAYNVKLSWAANSCSDCIAFMNVYNVWITQKANGLLRSDAAEKKWANSKFVQIRVLREVKALVTELTTRLERLGIGETAGVNKVVWKEHERPFVLKFVIAGAFYPNYFVKHFQGTSEDERERLKLLAGLDPYRTVYVQGWPLGQPGPLYARRIQDAFKECLPPTLGNIRVSFHSTRVFIQFRKNEYTQHLHGETAKKISSPVYKAIKMRQCDMPIEIPVLTEEESNRRARTLNLLNNDLLFFKTNRVSKKNSSGIRPCLPPLGINKIPVVIQNIVDPGHFWIQEKNLKVYQTKERIKCLLNASPDSLGKFDSPPKIGALVAAPHADLLYYRAKVQSYTGSSNVSHMLARILYIDYGYTAEKRLCDLRNLDDIKEIKEIPTLAMECVLANVRPSIAGNFSEQWSKAAHAYFKTTVQKPGNLMANIYSVVNGVIALELILNTTENEIININKCLVFHGFAIPRDEDYLSRCNHDLREKQAEMNAEERSYYEELQYDQTEEFNDTYAEPPSLDECYRTVTLRGPYSPLEIELSHLIPGAKGKKVNMSVNSVNSVLLDNNPEDLHQRLLVAGSVSQNIHSNNLTLYNTTFMPNLPGLWALIILTFTPTMELRRDVFGTRYIGALCGLGYDPYTKRSIFPAHDMEIVFDVEITIDDLLHINTLRHWMNIGMQLVEGGDASANMQEIITCQNKIKDAFLTLTEKSRKTQEQEMISHFQRWGRYDESLFMVPRNAPMNSIFRLHNALELDKESEHQETIKNLMKLRTLANEDPRTCNKRDIHCQLCDVHLRDVRDLRLHLFNMKHIEKEEKLQIVL